MCFLRKYTYVNRFEKNVVLKLFFVTRWRLRQLLRHPKPSGLPSFRFQIKQQQQVRRSRSRKQQQQLRQLWGGRKAEQTDRSSGNYFKHWQFDSCIFISFDFRSKVGDELCQLFFNFESLSFDSFKLLIVVVYCSIKCFKKRIVQYLKRYCYSFWDRCDKYNLDGHSFRS